MFREELCNECGECLEFCPYSQYDKERAGKEIAEMKAGAAPPIVATASPARPATRYAPHRPDPFDLINERQEQTGALGLSNKAFERYSKLLEIPSKIEVGEPGKPILNLCIVGGMVREQIRGPLFEGLSIVRGLITSAESAIFT